MDTSLAFCEFADTELTSLAHQLSSTFKFNLEELPRQYDRWRQKFDCGTSVEDMSLAYMSRQTNFQRLTETSKRVGVDLPITLAHRGIHQDSPSVMFIAQDPRRGKEAQSERITLATPFALHVPWGRETGKTTKLVFQAVKFWLDQGWRVYLTDAIKIYAYDHETDKARALPKGDRDLFDKMLAAEIQIFQPKVIVTIGSPAYRSVQKAKPIAGIVEIPHFSGANQNEWKKKLGGEQQLTGEAKLAWYRQSVEKILVSLG